MKTKILNLLRLTFPFFAIVVFLAPGASSAVAANDGVLAPEVRDALEDALEHLSATGELSEADKATLPDATINALLDEMAQLLARAVAEPDVRAAIQGATALRFDGDTEVLYKSLAAMPLTGVQNLEARLALQYTSGRVQPQGAAITSSAQALSRLRTLSSVVPKLQVAVRGPAASWDATAYTPLVAFMPEGVDDLSLEQVTAYDTQGQAYQLDAQVASDAPVIVVGMNERVDDNGRLLPLFVPNASGQIELAQKCDGVPNTLYYEKMQWLLLHDKKEPWPRGDPELALEVASQKMPIVNEHGGGPYAGEFYEANGTDIWYCYNRKLFLWNRANQGDFIEYFWYEKDGGDPIKIEFSIEGVGLSFTIDNGDDVMGHNTVDILDRLLNTHHNIGAIEWYRYAY